MKFNLEKISCLSRVLFLVLLTVFCADAGWSAFYQSNEQPNELSDRSRVLWRFQMQGQYSFVRPVTGADGTVYAVDVAGNLYALTPAGALKWQVPGAGNKGVAAGADGSVYTASENDIRSFDANGNLRWIFAINPRALITLGVAVGPDGNIYSVATESIGVFSLTPQGALRWATNDERYVRPPVDYGEIVFGQNGKKDQLYFYANGRIRAVRLADGATVFPLTVIDQPYGQPAVSPLDNSVHANVISYTPNGNTRWLLFNVFPSSAGFPAADVGPDGTHYVIYPARRLYALNPDGSVRYFRDLAEDFGDAVIIPSGLMLVSGTAGIDTNAVVGFDAATGTENWRETLPPENGTAQFITTRARFTPDSKTVYINTATDSTSFIYAISAGFKKGR